MTYEEHVAAGMRLVEQAMDLVTVYYDSEGWRHCRDCRDDLSSEPFTSKRVRRGVTCEACQQEIKEIKR